jgi:hypothetical protein
VEHSPSTTALTIVGHRCRWGWRWRWRRRWRRWGWWGWWFSRPYVPIPEIRKYHGSASGLCLDGLRYTDRGRTRTTCDPWCAGISCRWIVTIEPVQVTAWYLVVPNAYGQHHATSHSGTQLLQSSIGGKCVGVLEDALLRRAVGIGHGGIRAEAWHVHHRVLNDDTVLYVTSSNLYEVSSRSIVVGDELGCNGELRSGVDRSSRSKERCIAISIGVVVTAVAITYTTIATRTARLTRGGARMCVESARSTVALEDIKLSAA